MLYKNNSFHLLMPFDYEILVRLEVHYEEAQENERKKLKAFSCF